MQYKIATLWPKGSMIDTSEHQGENEWARGRTVERLRAKIDVVEDTEFTTNWHDPAKRKIANALLVTKNNVTTLPEVGVDYPLNRSKREDTVATAKEKTRHDSALRISYERVDSGFSSMWVSKCGITQ